MKFWFIVIAMVVALFTASHGQEKEKSDISDRVMHQIVSHLARQYFKPRKSPRTVYVMSANVKEEWLPAIRNVRFVLLKDGEQQNVTEAFLFDLPTRERNNYFVIFGYGSRGLGEIQGDSWKLKIINGRVKNAINQGTWGIVSDPGPIPLKRTP
jgi:hypothetical protein